MRSALRAQLAESWRALRDVFTNQNLRRLQLAWAGSVLGQWAYSVALAVYAYRQGGAAAVGIVALIRTIPAAACAPFASFLGDRFRRERVMLAADVARAVTIGAASAALFLDASEWLVYALAGLTAVFATAFGPAEKAVLPQLARTPEELTAANVASSTVESVGSFAGPAIGGLLLVATSTGVVFAATAGTFLWSAFLVSRIRSGDREPAEEPVLTGPRSIGREALAGFRAIIFGGRLRVLVALYAAQTLVAGALSVLVVVTALRLLDQGESGVGVLNAAIGVGGLVGALLALALVGRRRLAADFGLGILLWGAPLALIGIWPNSAAALVLLGVLGAGNTLVDVAGLTLLQRTASAEVLSRVFGVLESMLQGTIGLGAILAPLLIAGFGIRGALIITGSFLPVLAALFWRRLVAIDRDASLPGPEIELLRSLPLFAPLGPAKLEDVAAHLILVRFDAGTQIFAQGDRGDRFYVMDEGEVEIVADGEHVATLGHGDYFGEIALLRDVPRTATVVARTDMVAYALERQVFIAAVTSTPPSARAADAVIGARMGARA